MAKKKLNKVIKGLKKASKTHASQAKTLESIKMKKGGGAKSKTPANVANPSIYAKAKAKAKRKFSVYPSAYANSYMVQEYKRMGGKYKGAKKKAEGGSVRKVETPPMSKKDARRKKMRKALRVATAIGTGGQSEITRAKAKLLKKGVKKITKKNTGGSINLKPIPAENKGLPKLPKKVRNKMGFMQAGGAVKMVQGRGCGAMMDSKRKKTKVPM